MCFSVVRDEDVKLLNIDKVVWKIGRMVGDRFESAYVQFLYTPGKIYFKENFPEKFTPKDFNDGCGFHSFSSEEIARAIAPEKLKVRKFIIPAGGKYFSSKYFRIPDEEGFILSDRIILI